MGCQCKDGEAVVAARQRGDPAGLDLRAPMCLMRADHPSICVPHGHVGDDRPVASDPFSL